MITSSSTSLASFTAKTLVILWKVKALKIWLDPYIELKMELALSKNTLDKSSYLAKNSISPIKLNKRPFRWSLCSRHNNLATYLILLLNFFSNILNISSNTFKNSEKLFGIYKISEDLVRYFVLSLLSSLILSSWLANVLGDKYSFNKIYSL